MPWCQYWPLSNTITGKYQPIPRVSRYIDASQFCITSINQSLPAGFKPLATAYIAVVMFVHALDFHSNVPSSRVLHFGVTGMSKTRRCGVFKCRSHCSDCTTTRVYSQLSSKGLCSGAGVGWGRFDTCCCLLLLLLELTWHVLLLPPIRRSPSRPLSGAPGPSGSRGWSWSWNSTATRETQTQ